MKKIIIFIFILLGITFAFQSKAQVSESFDSYTNGTSLSDNGLWEDQGYDSFKISNLLGQGLSVNSIIPIDENKRTFNYIEYASASQGEQTFYFYADDKNTDAYVTIQYGTVSFTSSGKTMYQVCTNYGELGNTPEQIWTQIKIQWDADTNKVRFYKGWNNTWTDWIDCSINFSYADQLAINYNGLAPGVEGIIRFDTFNGDEYTTGGDDLSLVFNNPSGSYDSFSGATPSLSFSMTYSMGSNQCWDAVEINYVRWDLTGTQTIDEFKETHNLNEYYSCGLISNYTDSWGGYIYPYGIYSYAARFIDYENNAIVSTSEYFQNITATGSTEWIFTIASNAEIDYTEYRQISEAVRGEYNLLESEGFLAKFTNIFRSKFPFAYIIDGADVIASLTEMFSDDDETMYSTMSIEFPSVVGLGGTTSLSANESFDIAFISPSMLQDLVSQETWNTIKSLIRIAIWISVGFFLIGAIKKIISNFTDAKQ